MRLIVLVAACLACAGHAGQMRNTSDVPVSKSLATFLLASTPRSAFTLSGPGTPQLRIKRSSTPLMVHPAVGDPVALQEKMAQLQTQVELLQKQIKIAELQAQLAILRQHQGQLSKPAAPNSEYAPLGGNSDRAEHTSARLGKQLNAHNWGHVTGRQRTAARWQPAKSEDCARTAETSYTNCIQPPVAPRASNIFMGKDNVAHVAHQGVPPIHETALQQPPGRPRATEAVMQSSPQVPRADTIGQVASRGAPSQTSGSLQQFQQGNSIGKSDIIPVQGGSLRTWSYRTSQIDRLQVVLSTDGRPLDADVQLWQGPDNTPFKMRVYSEDGSVRPFSGVIATPTDGANTVAIRNMGQMEFPLAAHVRADDVDAPISDFRETSTIVQGGALRTYQFNPSVESVEIMLKTDGRPLNARIELLQGPNNNKQVIELYSEDGLERPFFAVLDAVGTGNVVRLVNTAPLEFPLFASVQPHSINENVSPLDPVIGGGRRF